MEEKDKIKDLFSSKLKDFEPEVPASLWGGLDQLLSQQPAAADPSSASSSSSSSSGTSATASKASLIKTVLITAGVAAAVVTGVLLAPKGDNVIPEEPQIVVVDEVLPDTIETVDTTKVLPALTMPPAMTKTLKIEEVPVKEEIIPEQEPQEEPTLPKRKPIIEEEPLITEDEEPIPVWMPKKKYNNGFSVSLSANSGLLAQNTTQNGGDIMFSRDVRSTKFNEILAEENKEFKLKHRLPISVGLKVSKGIAPNLSLESGIVYTYLSSKITSNSVFDIEENQNFHYLGIPLSLNYTFYELGKGKVYLSVGGMVQKDIKGQYESKMGFSKTDITDEALAHILYYSEPYYIKESRKQSKPQFSANAALGVAYPIHKKLYLYGTFGGAYYFDAGNKYSTIYSDRKLQLDLNLGVKFDF